LFFREFTILLTGYAFRTSSGDCFGSAAGRI
jgi:hypothetical protein